MTDYRFESRVQRLFAEAPSLSDAALFAARVETRMERGWTARRLMIGAAGLLGGTVAVTQLLVANIGQRLGTVSQDSLEAARRGLAQIPLPGGGQIASLRALPFGGEAGWLVLGLAVLAAALLATRSVEEL